MPKKVDYASYVNCIPFAATLGQAEMDSMRCVYSPGHDLRSHDPCEQ